MRSTKWLRKTDGRWVLVEVINGKQMPIGIGQVCKAGDRFFAQFLGKLEHTYFDTLDEAKTWMQTVWRMK